MTQEELKYIRLMFRIEMAYASGQADSVESVCKELEAAKPQFTEEQIRQMDEVYALCRNLSGVARSDVATRVISAEVKAAGHLEVARCEFDGHRTYHVWVESRAPDVRASAYADEMTQIEQVLRKKGVDALILPVVEEHRDLMMHSWRLSAGKNTGTKGSNVE